MLSKIELTVQSNRGCISFLFLGKADPHWPCSDQKSKQYSFLIEDSIFRIYLKIPKRKCCNLQTSTLLSKYCITVRVSSK